MLIDFTLAGSMSSLTPIPLLLLFEFGIALASESDVPVLVEFRGEVPCEVRKGACTYDVCSGRGEEGGTPKADVVRVVA